MTNSQTRQASKFLHTISDFERIGDHASAISKVARELHDKKMEFSDSAKDEIVVLEAAVSEIVEKTTDAFMEDDLAKAKEIEPLRQLIAILCRELKNRHIERLQKGKCDVQQGFPFNDMLTNLERIAAHCSNVAVAMIESELSEFDTHQYLKGLREMKDDKYTKLFDNYEKKYDIGTVKKNKKNK